MHMSTFGVYVIEPHAFFRFILTLAKLVQLKYVVDGISAFMMTVIDYYYYYCLI